MKKTIKPTTLALAVAAASWAATGYSAQLEEVIVTAQKRSQTLQEVPSTVQAFTQDFMEKAGVEDVRDLVNMTPGFNGATEDSFTDAMAMRGISTNDFGVGGDPSIAMFVDGVWAGRTGGSQMSFFDMDRAEVVKGPQGTLFGRNAIAGAVDMHTKKPVQESEGKLSLGVAEYGRIESTLTYNTALSDNWAIRGSVYHMSEDGYLENTQGGDDFGMHDRSAARLALGYQGDSAEMVITAGYEDRQANASIYWDPELGLPEDKVSTDLLGEDANDESEISYLTVNFEYELSEDWTLTSITGWKTYDYRYLEDYDARPELINNYFLNTDIDYLSQELRLNFTAGENLTGFIGASYYEEEIDAYTGSTHDENALCNAIGRTDADDFAGPVVNGCADVNFLSYWLEVDPADVTAEDIAYATDYVTDFKAEGIYNLVENDGFGIYGDLSWDASDKLNVTYGIRYTSDTKQMSMMVPESGGYLGNNFNFEYVIPEFITDEETWTELTHRIAFNYQLSEQISVYLNYGQGYKSGGYATYGADISEAEWDEDEYVVLSGAKPLKFDPETVDSYEIGFKSRLLDESLQLNASLYRYDYTDLQLLYFDQGSSLVDNLGEASGTGAELDIRYLPTDQLDIFFTYAYQDTEVTDDTGVVGTACGAPCKGNSLPFAPRGSAALLATYRIPVEGAEWALSAEAFHQSRQYSDLDELKYISQPKQTEVNLRLGYETESWDVTLWVENLFEEEYFERGWANADLDNTYGYGLTNTLVWPSKPRTVGVNFSMDF